MKVSLYRCFCFAFLCSMAWDIFYMNGIGRMLDYLAFVILIILFLFSSDNDHHESNPIASYMYISIFILLLIGLQSLVRTDPQAIKSYFGFCMGISSYFLVRKLNFLPNFYFFRNVICFLFFFQFVQLVTFIISGHYVDFSALTGGVPSRGVNETVSVLFLRSSSIYQEPNGYAVTLLFLFSLFTATASNSLRYRSTSQFLYTYLLVCFSLISSGSIFGIISSLCLSFLIAFYFILSILVRRSIRWNHVSQSLFLKLVFASCSVAFFVICISEILSTILEIAFKRLTLIDSDASALARFQVNSDLLSFLSTESLHHIFFGNGLTTYDGTFQLFLGANCYSFLLYSVGIFGFLCLLLFSYTPIFSFRSKMLLFSTEPSLLGYFPIAVVFLCLTLSLFTWPLYTYQFYWIFLGILHNAFSSKSFYK